MRRTPILRLALASVLVLAMVACAAPAGTPGPGTPPAGTPPAGTPPADTPPAGTPPAGTPDPGAASPSPVAAECPANAHDQRVEMWSPLTGPDGDEMTELANRYSSENEFGITVEHLPNADYITALNAAAAANQLPAMTVVRVVNVGELAERNVLQPYSDEVMGILGGADFEGDFPENLWGPGEYKGERYSVPLDTHPLVMYYNRELFQQAGVEEPGVEPWTREQFDAAMEALDGAGIRPLAIGTHFQGGALFQTLIQQYGGALTNEDGTEVTYNSDAGVQAMERLRELQQSYSEEITGTGDPEVQEFHASRAAIVMHGPWWITGMQAFDFVGYAPVPTMGDQYAVWGGSHQLALTSSDENVQAAAACWISWLTENSVEWGAAGQVPARNSARNDPQLEQIAPVISNIRESADDVIILPQVPGLEHALWGEGFGPVVDGYLTGQVADIRAALDDAASRSQQFVDENRELYGD